MLILKPRVDLDTASILYQQAAVYYISLEQNG